MPASDSNKDSLKIKVNCSNCSISNLCLPEGLTVDEVGKLDNVIESRNRLRKGEYLFKDGEEFRAIYAIKSGSLKSYLITPDGEEQVNGFYLPGEIVGLNAITSQKHSSFAIALEDAVICEIPYQEIENLAGDVPELRHQLMSVMSKEILSDQQLFVLLSKRSAEERLAVFLTNLSERLKRRGLSPTHIRLTMTRGDIGNYLGLTVETVSRLFTRFQKQALVKVNGKEVEIIDTKALHSLAGVHCSTHG